MTPAEMGSEYTLFLSTLRPDVYPQESIRPRDVLYYLTTLDGERPKGGRLMRTFCAAEGHRRLDAGEPLVVTRRREA